MRQTIQRQIILEELRNLKTHPTAKELYNHVKKRIPTISFGTVYRTLHLLRDRGEIIELAFADRSSRWDGFTHPHQHFYCESCGGVYDVEEDISNKLAGILSRVPGKVKRMHLKIYGICDKCL